MPCSLPLQRLHEILRQITPPYNFPDPDCLRLDSIRSQLLRQPRLRHHRSSTHRMPRPILERTQSFQHLSRKQLLRSPPVKHHEQIKQQCADWTILRRIRSQSHRGLPRPFRPIATGQMRQHQQRLPNISRPIMQTRRQLRLRARNRLPRQSTSRKHYVSRGFYAFAGQQSA